DNAVMQFANESIPIYNGDFSLIDQNDNAILVKNGEIQYTWFPDTGAKFSGEISFDLRFFVEGFNKTYSLHTDSWKIDNVLLISLDDQRITGIINSIFIKGDKTISVQKVQFSLPNFIYLHG